MTLSRVCMHHPSKGVHVAVREGTPANTTALCGQELKGVIWLRKAPITCAGCGQELHRLHAL